MIEKLILSISILLLVAFISAGCLQDVLTPAYLDPDVIAINGGYKSVNPIYTSLFDAIRLKNQVINKFKYSVDALNMSITNSIELRNNIFDPNSGIGMMFPMGVGLVAGWFGLSRPSDKKKLNGNNKLITT